ncbi:MAG: XamI family restriction endonuclease [Blastocatellia bacterium]|nr:XamI family restriction endonuclease [Blastocatellia bacterium]
MTLVERSLWTPEQFAEDLAESKAIFRRERLEEPLEAYSEAFEIVRDAVENLIEETVDLSQLEEKALGLLKKPATLEAFRYLAGPPISKDDLETLVDTTSLAPAFLDTRPELVLLLVQTIKDVLDRNRFPWVSDQREPTMAERHAAIIASTALIATQRVATSRRTKGKKAQEAMVREALLGYGLEEVTVPGGSIPSTTHASAPKPGQFCGKETKLGGRKADLIVCLWDSRIMPIECKVSNSSINSLKRLNAEAAAKAKGWIDDFGRRTIVPVAVISGVFKREYLVDAQDRGLTIYWSHKLNELTKWMDKVRDMI